ncbi:MAG: transketolase [Candidatus Sungiibacteriota bacterium]|uniref:Transketolase n=1 Tax=Candidatus Sungiibacteriota bacterium TaxID=2750080 RepID=A0A7T5RJU1_9BACT|nr:MAG: transketolase [Candidatus Sungbacteria bacterium]
MINIKYVPPREMSRIREIITDPFLRAQILADVFRLNTLSMIMEAGSGHIGTSFSCMDILTWLWLEEMQNPNDKDANPSDTYFSSKGHDAPALYSLLIGLEKLPYEYVHKLRRLGGLPGHPDIDTPYVMANTGSLGMGISKARGMALANRLQGKSGRLYVLTGDGELQEGQVWESLQPTVNGGFAEITVIVDHNKMQSDSHIKETSDLGNLEDKFRSFGWVVARSDGHDFHKLAEILAHFKSVQDRPQILIADTIKGKGVSFMERLGEDGLYKFHSGAPSPEHYEAAVKELTDRINNHLAVWGEAPVVLETKEIPPRVAPAPHAQKLITAYTDELVKIASERKEVVAMDADLVLDTGLIPFKKEFPERYVECGIAEQDMVSLAGGMALKGMLPVVHSFECFLSTRPNEHFYNNATEKTKIIYTGSLAGLLPGTPGHSHQSVRGISALGAIPGLTLIQPCNEKETRLTLRWAVEKNPESTYIRLVSIPCETPYELPETYELHIGQGVVLRDGKDAAIFAYGPVMLSEAVKAADLLMFKGISAAVINFPWLNRVDEKWFLQHLASFRIIITIDDHYVTLGQGTLLSSAVAKAFTIHPKVVNLGVEEIPVCGQNQEVLEYHKLDAESIAKRIEALFK